MFKAIIIDENYAQLQTPEEVVAPLYISVGYASKLFRKYANESIFDYLLRCKMEEAIEGIKTVRYEKMVISFIPF